MRVGDRVHVETADGSFAGRVVMTAPDYVIIACGFGTVNLRRDTVLRVSDQRPQD